MYKLEISRFVRNNEHQYKMEHLQRCGVATSFLTPVLMITRCHSERCNESHIFDIKQFENSP